VGCGFPLLAVLGAGAELAVAPALAPPVAGGCALAVGVTCWLDWGTLAVFADADDNAGGGGGGVGGGTPASRREANGGVSLCCAAVEACKRCDAYISEGLAEGFTSDVILGALGTAALPGDSKRLMSACNRRASSDCYGKPCKFNVLVA
jgi:hypothetical protein